MLLFFDEGYGKNTCPIVGVEVLALGHSVWYKTHFSRPSLLNYRSIISVRRSRVTFVDGSNPGKTLKVSAVAVVCLYSQRAFDLFI